MKFGICTLVGTVGGVISAFFGGWNQALEALLICMAVDYIMGLMVAGVFHASPKTTGGGLDSRVGWKGLIRKCVVLLIVLVAHEMDVILGTAYVRDAVIIGFCANEILSIVENAGLMGLELPKKLTDALEQMMEEKQEEVK